MIASVTAGIGAPLDQWHWRSPDPTGNRLHGVGAGQDGYVVVGELGTIVVSTDARNWQAVESGTRNSLRAVAWGNGTWVAVGDFGEIRTSTNAEAWTLHPTGYYHDLLSVAYGDGLFVAVGVDSTILTSPDGEVWTLRTTGNHPLRAIAWGDGRFVAVGGEPPSGSSLWTRLDGRPLILTSPDGVSWTRQDVQVDGQMTCVAFGAGRFVAGTTSMRMVMSIDGHDWFEGAHASGYHQLECQALAWVQDRFLATIGSLTTFAHGYLTSSDGLGWTFEPFVLNDGPIEGRVISLATGSAGVVGVTVSWPFSLRTHLLRSVDGREWYLSERRVPEFDPPITFAGGRFFLRETPTNQDHRDYPETVYLVSRDACHWESVTASQTEAFGLPAYGAGHWVASGPSGSFLVSSDAVEWQVVKTESRDALWRTAFVDGRFVATGDGGVLLTSPDALTWDRQQLDTTHPLAMAQWSDGTYAVAETGGAGIWTSKDAMHWTRQTLPQGVHELETLLTWEEGFCALIRLEPYGPVMLIRSINGHDWEVESTPAPSASFHLATGGGWLLLFQGQGSQTFYARRAGNASWSAHRLPWITVLSPMTFSAPAGSAFGHDTFVLTRYGSSILQSEPLNDMAPRLTRPIHAVAAAPDSDLTFRAVTVGSGPMRYQWRRGGSDIPGATSPFFTLPAEDLSRGPITVRIMNTFGSEESDPATVSFAAPATVQWLPGHQALQVWGTPHGRYRLEQVQELTMGAGWSPISAFEIPSWGGSVRVKIPAESQWPPARSRFYQATFK
jgi:hypothetical protein